MSYEDLTGQYGGNQAKRTAGGFRGAGFDVYSAVGLSAFGLGEWSSRPGNSGTGGGQGAPVPPEAQSVIFSFRVPRSQTAPNPPLGVCMAYIEWFSDQAFSTPTAAGWLPTFSLLSIRLPLFNRFWRVTFVAFQNEAAWASPTIECRAQYSSEDLEKPNTIALFFHYILTTALAPLGTRMVSNNVLGTDSIIQGFAWLEKFRVHLWGEFAAGVPLAGIDLHIKPDILDGVIAAPNTMPDQNIVQDAGLQIVAANDYRGYGFYTTNNALWTERIADKYHLRLHNKDNALNADKFVISILAGDLE